ncbi:MAG TPA: porin [Azonexus sp.]|nr:porin [Azonexus sp.]
MQKKIIALAIAGLASTAAFAQSNVTVYGVVDAAYVYTGVNGGTTLNAGESHGKDTSLIQSGQLAGSRIGFKGTEDLGNGLKAVFVLEYALDIDGNFGVGSSASGLNARQQFVGLSGKLGDLTLGRQYAPGYYTVALDATVASPALSSVDAGQAFLGSTIRAATPARWNNAVNFKSASFGGVSVQMTRGFGEIANNLEAGASTGVGVDFAAGPVAVKYVYHRAAFTQQLNAGIQDEHYLGASFDAKVVKLFASAQTVDQGGIARAGGRAAEGSMYQFGAIVPVGKGNIHTTLSYADRNGSTRAATPFRGEQSSVSLVYTHGLSKRTTLYTGYRYTDADVLNGGSILNAFGAGINHTF